MNIHQNSCTCYDVDLDKLIYQSKSTVDSLSAKKANARSVGFSFTHDAVVKLELLNSYLKILQDENLNISLGGKGCLNCNDLQKLAEKTRQITTNCSTSSRKDQIVDDSKEAEWISKNPYCVSREKWEELAYRVCGDLRLELVAVQDVCDITFELIRKLIPCDLMVSIAVYKQQCDLGLKIKRTEEECDLDFEILSSETKCDIDLKTYKTLVEKNFSYDIIRNVYEHGCTLELNDEGEGDVEIHLVTPLRKYPIKNLRFSKIPEISNLSKYNIDISGSEYIKNPNKFIDKLKQDYGK